ncbi:hypothetical protein ADUPG1_006816 [Aduncisulcus paluster]|uniref:Uncharacterized protein n=1 Tax=Aduncisulcus paluster TaxID=2918883 RepID=A0ABQ5KJP8_9EUKA|nr:hypothetical protein ADUPG1_006816 [Aduncisulcus paluster]
MRIFGSEALIYGLYDTNYYRGPFPVGHHGVIPIDETKATAEGLKDMDHDNLFKFLQGEAKLRFYPNLFLSFDKPRPIKELYICHHSYDDKIVEFNAEFSCLEGAKIKKEYEMKELRPYQVFWQSFPVGIENVISCDIHIVSKCPKAGFCTFFGIRFLADQEKELEWETIDRLSYKPWI